MKLYRKDVRFKRGNVQESVKNISRHILWEKIYSKCRIYNKRNINRPVQNIIHMNISHTVYVVSFRKIQNRIQTI